MAADDVADNGTEDGTEAEKRVGTDISAVSGIKNFVGFDFCVSQVFRFQIIYPELKNKCDLRVDRLFERRL